MRVIRLFTGHELRTACIGCAVANLTETDYPGTLHVSPFFHVHQDIETALAGFVIISTRRHVTSIADFTMQELQHFGPTLVAARKALSEAGFETVYIFQNEDSADHFHLWLFPAHPWMKELGKGPAMLAEALRQVKTGKGAQQPSHVVAIARRLSLSMERYLD